MFAWTVADLSQWLAPLVVAPFAGSFLGVLIQRLPSGRPVAFGRSACEHCHTQLATFDLVPLVSYVRQRGRCRYCGEAIGRFHLTVELAAIAVVVWTLLAETDPGRVWADCWLGWTLLALAWIDWRWLLLPDVLTLTLLLAGLLVTLLAQPDAITAHAAAAAIGYLGLRGVAWSYRLVRRREGMGAGDAKLFGAAGAWLGLAPLPLVLLLAALLGIGAAGCLALSGRRLLASTALPFGPCLALALWLVWLHGGWIVQGGAAAWSG